MPTVRRSRTLAAPPAEVWAVVADPHHLPRWWPRVERVEAVADGEFTEVMRSQRGNVVRADFRVVQVNDGHRIVFSQQIEGTPFARVLASAETEINLLPAQAGKTEISIELRQGLRGVFPRMGGWLVRRAGAATLSEALDGLGRIFG